MEGVVRMERTRGGGRGGGRGDIRKVCKHCFKVIFRLKHGVGRVMGWGGVMRRVMQEGKTKQTKSKVLF